jgi:hypothetical protein
MDERASGIERFDGSVPGPARLVATTRRAVEMGLAGTGMGASTGVFEPTGDVVVAMTTMP